jgi:hypothetical protein
MASGAEPTRAPAHAPQPQREEPVLDAAPDADGSWSVLQPSALPAPSPWPREWTPNPAAKALTAEELDTKRQEIRNQLAVSR